MSYENRLSAKSDLVDSPWYPTISTLVVLYLNYNFWTGCPFKVWWPCPIYATRRNISNVSVHAFNTAKHGMPHKISFLNIWQIQFLIPLRMSCSLYMVRDSLYQELYHYLSHYEHTVASINVWKEKLTCCCDIYPSKSHICEKELGPNLNSNWSPLSPLVTLRSPWCILISIWCYTWAPNFAKSTLYVTNFWRESGINAYEF